MLLWAGDVFHWEYWWWNFPNIVLIVLLGYATFFAMAAWVYDMRDRGRQLTVVGTLAAIDVALILLFGPILSGSDPAATDVQGVPSACWLVDPSR